MISLRRLRPATLFIVAILMTMTARANLSTYIFSSGTGTAYDMSGATDIFEGSQECSGTNIDDNANNATNIGFTFRFDDVDYTKFSASTNGVIGLFRSWGSTNVTKCWVNLLNQTSGGCSGIYGQTLDSIPQIVGLWDDMRVPGQCNNDGFNGSIRYKLFGTSPNRVLVVEYTDIEYDYYNYNYGTMQVRLYEGSNAIEYWYTGFGDGYNGDGASIGVASVGGTSFMSVTPGRTTSMSRTTVNNGVDPSTIADNTLYTISPCGARLSGSTSQGGTTAMANGDTLFARTSVQVGSSTTFRPFTVTVPAGACPSQTFTMQVTGLYASEYVVSPTSGTITAGTPLTPTITITPTCSGPRPATLTVTISDGSVRQYQLAATATSQGTFSGNVAQGGTSGMTSGDTLMSNVVVPRGESTTVQPFTITNANTDPASTPLAVTFSLVDPTNQYSISPIGASLNPGQTVTPSITFDARGVAVQEATLTVTAGCETRVYTLRAFSSAPGGELIADGFRLDSTQSLYNAQNSCVGSQVNAIPITVHNTGNGDFEIRGIAIYRTDTVVAQGTAPYALLRDVMGQPIPSSDYMIMLTPGSAPLTPEQALALPFRVPEGTSRTIYIVFVGRESGRRYARAYVQTNGQNLMTTNAAGVAVPGLVRFDLVARAVGSQLASTPAGARLRPLVLPSVRVDDTSTARLAVSNAGACDLLIRRDKLRIIAGDVNEFALVSVLPATPVDGATNAYRIAPGATDYITVRFTPSRSGSRMATLLLQTNDSSISLPGLVERGVYRLDLYGFGRAGLDAANLVLPPVLIGGTVSGVARLENSSTAAVDIRQITIVGPDAAQFSASAAQPWPTLPTRVLPGAQLLLGVELAPTGLAGARNAVLEVITTTDDTIRVAIRGEAGIAQLDVAPTSLFDGVQISIGQYVRRTVTIVNSGTFPVHLQTPVITGPDAGNYSLGMLPRLDLAPGQIEYLEVTFSPQTQGVSSATLEIPSSLGTRLVQLGGETLGAKNDDDPTGRTGGDGGHDGVSGVVTGGALALRVEAIRPNPTSADAELDFTIGRAASVVVTLHDGAGRLLGTLADGRYDAGRHALRVATGALASGTYHVRIAIDGTTTSTTLTVAR